MGDVKERNATGSTRAPTHDLWCKFPKLNFSLLSVWRGMAKGEGKAASLPLLLGAVRCWTWHEPLGGFHGVSPFFLR